MKSDSRKKLSPNAKPKGFALVVTLTLMILLAILALGMLSLSTVELRSGSVSSAKKIAERNALMALNIALGQLQSAAGADQRITARAEILDSDPSTSAVDSVNQPYWTGVWKTGKASLDVSTTVDPVPQRKTSLGSLNATQRGALADIANKATWLVSLPSSTVDPRDTNLSVSDNLNSMSASASNSGLTGSATNPTAVILAKNIGRKDPSALPSDTTGFIVAAPLVTITDKPPGLSSSRPIGKYAYWVADEGVKAKINLTDPTLAADSTSATQATTAQAHFLAPQANAIHKMDGLVTDSSQDFRTSNKVNYIDQLPKVITPGLMALLPTTPDGLNLKPYLSDITTYSQGILADVKNGGLKKDLTAAFESTAGYNILTSNYGYGANMLYRNYNGLTIPFKSYANSSIESQTDGLQWLELYSYYSIYKSQISTPDGVVRPISISIPKPPTTSGSLTALPYVMSPRSLTFVPPPATSPSYMRGELVPEMVASRVDVAMESYNSGGKWKLRLRYYPQVVLYNPYNCRLNISGSQIRNVISVFNGYRINVYVGPAPGPGNLVTTTPIPIHPDTTQAMTAMTPSFIEPGESLVFGLTKDWPIGNSKKPPSPWNDYNPTGYTQVVATGATMSDKNAYIMDLPVNAQRFFWYTYPGETTETKVNRYFYGDAYQGTSEPEDMVTVSLFQSPNTPLEKFECGGGSRLINAGWQWPFSIYGSSNTQNSGSFTYTPRDTDWDPILIRSLEGNPRLITGYFYRKKGITLTDPNYINGQMSFPLYHGNAAEFQIFDNSRNFVASEINPSKFGTFYNDSSIEIQPYLDTSSNNWITSFGDTSVGSTTPISGSLPPKRILRDVPGQPLMSLGQFMHMPTSNNTVNAGNYVRRSSGSMFIGGSFCSPYIASDKTLYDTGIVGARYILLDDSYLSNDTLFDRFFFSTVPPAAPLDPQAPQQWKEFNNANPGTTLSSASKPLPNSRMKPYYANGVAPQMSELRDFDKAAANLSLDGAFNVNSTSIDAWKALLSSLSGKDMTVYNPDTKKTVSIDFPTAKPNPIPRFWASRGTVNAATGAWDGARSFSDTEITELATRIVEQVKLRGPFLSMSDFLNRRLGANSKFTRVGCLQAAIDNTSPNINKNVKTAGVPATTTASEIIDPNAPPLIAANMVDGAEQPLNTTVGMPGYLMQQDIVQAFSPAMTVRSDTFVIRAYGEAINPATGVTEAKAWAEAVVQRTPEFIDNQNAPEPSAALASLNTTNTQYGRRYKVIGFRWLTPNDL